MTNRITSSDLEGMLSRCNAALWRAKGITTKYGEAPADPFSFPFFRAHGQNGGTALFLCHHDGITGRNTSTNHETSGTKREIYQYILAMARALELANG